MALIALEDRATGQAFGLTNYDNLKANVDYLITLGLAKVTASAWSGGPPASPSDGDVWRAVNVDANGTVWTFRYNAGSASAYKWEFIGGPPLLSEILTGENTASSALVNLATPGPTWVVGRSGDYEVALQLQIVNISGSTNGASAQVLDNGAVLTSAVYAGASPTASTNYWSVSGDGIARGLTAGHTLQVFYQVSFGGGTAQFAYRRLFVQPVRIA